MSERELKRIEVLSQVADGTMSATVMGMSARQVQRLLRQFRTGNRRSSAQTSQNT